MNKKFIRSKTNPDCFLYAADDGSNSYDEDLM